MLRSIYSQGLFNAVKFVFNAVMFIFRLMIAIRQVIHRGGWDGFLQINMLKVDQKLLSHI